MRIHSHGHGFDGVEVVGVDQRKPAVVAVGGSVGAMTIRTPDESSRRNGDPGVLHRVQARMDLKNVCERLGAIAQAERPLDPQRGKPAIPTNCLRYMSSAAACP